MKNIFFRGASNVTIDDKGRMGIPSRYRDVLDLSCKGALILTADVSGCVLIYPHPEWSSVEQQLLNLPSLNKQSRFLQRLMVGHATECEIDSQGRILLPTPLRVHAKLKKQSLLIGQGRKFELWDQTQWKKECDFRIDEENNNKEMSEVLKSVRF